QPPQPVESPPGRERAGPDVGLAKRCRVGVVRNALCQLAPHDRYPELVANYSSLRGAGIWSSAVAGGDPSRHPRERPGWRGGERGGGGVPADTAGAAIFRTGPPSPGAPSLAVPPLGRASLYPASLYPASLYPASLGPPSLPSSRNWAIQALIS